MQRLSVGPATRGSNKATLLLGVRHNLAHIQEVPRFIIFTHIHITTFCIYKNTQSLVTFFSPYLLDPTRAELIEFPPSALWTFCHGAMQEIQTASLPKARNFQESPRVEVDGVAWCYPNDLFTYRMHPNAWNMSEVRMKDNFRNAFVWAHGTSTHSAWALKMQTVCFQEHGRCSAQHAQCCATAELQGKWKPGHIMDHHDGVELCAAAIRCAF